MKLFPLVGLVLLAISAGLPMGSGSTGDCDGHGSPALGIIELPPVAAGRGALYVDDRDYVFGNGIWIYEESNGHYVGGLAGQLDPGLDLQRGGSSPLSKPEVCSDDSPYGPDQLIDSF